mgnify:CR=1 FL=1
MYTGEKVKTLKELRKRLASLAAEIRDIEKACGYDENYSVCNLESAQVGAEKFFLQDELCGILNTLDRAADATEYLCGEVKVIGVLRKMPSGKYALPGWYELCCGSAVEILVEDDDHYMEIDGEYRNVPYWCAGRIEHDGHDYYFTENRATSLDGAQARIRR